MIVKKVYRLLLRLIRGLKTAISVWYRVLFAPALPKNSDGKVYVNLGCGVNTSSEFINIDTRMLPNVHYIHEIQQLPMFDDNSVDMIYASHLVEHIPREELKKTFKEWHRVLKPGGVLRIGVPHFDNLVRVYELSGRKVESIVNQLLGQNAPYDDHHTIWNMEYARELFMSTGFSKVYEWDAKNADHHSFKDKSQREMTIAGETISISLNIEARK